MITIINRLKLIKPKIRTKISKGSIDVSNDSFLGKKSIPVISRLNKSRYNGIPRPARAMTAKYRPNIPRGPTIHNGVGLKHIPKGNSGLMKSKSKNRINSASDHNLLRPIITKISSSRQNF